MFTTQKMHKEIDFRIKSINIRIDNFLKLIKSNPSSQRGRDYKTRLCRAERILGYLIDAKKQVDDGIDVRDIALPVQKSNVKHRPILSSPNNSDSYNFMLKKSDRRPPNLINLDYPKIRQERKIIPVPTLYCRHKIVKTDTEIIETVFRQSPIIKSAKLTRTVFTVTHYPIDSKFNKFVFPNEKPANRPVQSFNYTDDY